MISATEVLFVILREKVRNRRVWVIIENNLTGMWTPDLDLNLNVVLSLVVQLLVFSSPSTKTEVKLTEFLNNFFILVFYKYELII